MKRVQIVFVMVALLTISSCTKKDDAPSQTDQLKTILTAKMWKLSSTVMITTSGNVNQTIPTCKNDDLWEYNANGNFAKYPGTVKCTTGEVTLLGTWEIVNNNAGLKITTSSGSYYTDEIILLESNKLQVKYALGSGAYIDTYIPN